MTTNKHDDLETIKYEQTDKNGVTWIYIVHIGYDGCVRDVDKKRK